MPAPRASTTRARIQSRQMNRKTSRHYPIADDPIPAEAIRLSQAFKELLERAKRRSAIPLPEGALDSALVTIEQFGKDPEEILLSENETIEIRVKAACLFRLGLSDDLASYVRDPDFDRILKLNPEGWWFPDALVPVDFDDWISADTMPGPKGTIINGKKRPIFLMQIEFDNWLTDAFTRQFKGKRVGGYWIADRPLIEEMRKLMVDGNAKSAREAADKVAAKAAGRATIESKADRLRKAYSELFNE